MTRHDTDNEDGKRDSTPARSRAVETLAGVAESDRVRTVGLVLLVALVVPFVVFAVPQVVGAEQSYVVLSGSMEPAIPTGSAVIVERASPDAVERGDVITFDGGSGELTTTHRVVEVQTVDGERRFRTKGDNNEDPDPRPVPESALVGRVVELSVPGLGSALFVIPYIGYVVQFAKTTVGFGLLVVLPFALLVVSELRNYVRADEANDGADGTDGSAPRAAESTTDGGSPPTTDETPPPRVDGQPGDADTGTTPDADAGSDTHADDAGLLTVPVGYLTVGVGLLAAAGAFVGQRAIQAQDPVAATAAVGALTTCVLLCGLVLSNDDRTPETVEGDPVSSPSAGSADGTRIVDGTVPERLRERARIEVDDREIMLEMAAERNVWPVRDGETGDVFLFDEEVAYVLSPSVDDVEPSDAATEPSVDDAVPRRTGGDAAPAEGTE